MSIRYCTRTVPFLVLFGICGMWEASDALAGIGVQSGFQVNNGTFGIVGTHLDRAVFPLLHVRPTFELAKKSGVTIYNPSLDIYLNLNPIGIGPQPYVGAGAGWHATRRDVRNGGTRTDNNVNVNVFGGIRSSLVPFTTLFIEVKGVFVDNRRTARVLLGLSLSL